MSATATFKIGLNRGRRRIWLDGKRLTAAGFIGGAAYTCRLERGIVILTLGEKQGAQQRKVTGRPDGKPIIDITGWFVSFAFAPDVTHVDVLFGDDGTIEIAPHGVEALPYGPLRGRALT